MPELRHTIAEWISHVLRRMAPGVIIPEVIDLEDISMLEENLIEWSEKKEKDGARKILLRQLERRFGPLSEEIAGVSRRSSPTGGWIDWRTRS